MVSVNRDISDRKRALVVEERERIARDLHDSVSQALFSMTLQVRGLELALKLDGRAVDDPVSAGISDIRGLTRRALAEMHSLIVELRPEALIEEGLVAALARHSAAIEAREGLTVNVSLPSDQSSFRPAVEENLFRVSQEALNNVVKHAAATTVHVRLAGPDQGSGAIELEITDDGVGFDTDVVRPGHLGLRTMSERAASLGGTLEVTSAPGSGTTVRARLPGHRADQA
jgi:signal transduction histidine kinase